MEQELSPKRFPGYAIKGDCSHFALAVARQLAKTLGNKSIGARTRLHGGVCWSVCADLALWFKSQTRRHPIGLTSVLPVNRQMTRRNTTPPHSKGLQVRLLSQRPRRFSTDWRAQNLHVEVVSAPSCSQARFARIN